MQKPPESTPPSEAAKKLAATIVKRANQSVREGLGINAEFKPIGLETLIEMYLEDARKEGRREAAERLARNQTIPQPCPICGSPSCSVWGDAAAYHTKGALHG